MFLMVWPCQLTVYGEPPLYMSILDYYNITCTFLAFSFSFLKPRLCNGLS